MIRGIVFVDPLSANDNTYKTVFPAAQEQKIAQENHNAACTRRYGMILERIISHE
jgi:hypothetical protein